MLVIFPIVYIKSAISVYPHPSCIHIPTSIICFCFLQILKFYPCSITFLSTSRCIYLYHHTSLCSTFYLSLYSALPIYLSLLMPLPVSQTCLSLVSNLLVCHSFVTNVCDFLVTNFLVCHSNPLLCHSFVSNLLICHSFVSNLLVCHSFLSNLLFCHWFVINQLISCSPAPILNVPACYSLVTNLPVCHFPVSYQLNCHLFAVSACLTLLCFTCMSFPCLTSICLLLHCLTHIFISAPSLLLSVFLTFFCLPPMPYTHLSINSSLNHSENPQPCLSSRLLSASSLPLYFYHIFPSGHLFVFYSVDCDCCHTFKRLANQLCKKLLYQLYSQTQQLEENNSSYKVKLICKFEKSSRRHVNWLSNTTQEYVTDASRWNENLIICNFSLWSFLLEGLAHS